MPENILCENVRIVIGKGKGKYLWATNITGEYTMPVKISVLKRSVVKEIWGKDMRLFAIETADDVSRTLHDHIVISEDQARKIVKRLEGLLK